VSCAGDASSIGSAGSSLSSLRRVNPRIAVALLVAGVAALGLIVLGATSGGEDSEPVAPPDRFAGASLPQGLSAPNFELRDQEGRRVSMRSLRGRPVVVTFLYTHCQDTCPIMAQTVRGALDDLGHDVPALAIAVDPPNDTPQSARKFLAEQRVTGRLDFVLGSRADLRPVWDGFGVQPQRVTQEHIAHITLVDARGVQRVGYPASQATPERIAHDLRLLEREAS
jgi:protein SCO1/2